MLKNFRTANCIPVVKGVSYFLAHVPSMIRHGSKPSREILEKPYVLGEILNHINSFEDCVGYVPNQVFIGNLNPDDLNNWQKPWYKNPYAKADRQGAFGEIMPEDEFLGLMKVCDEFNLLYLEEDFLNKCLNKMKDHPLINDDDIEKIFNKGKNLDEIKKQINDDGAMPLYINGDILIGCCRKGHDQDNNLMPDIIIENLTNRASGVMAMRHLASKYVNAEKFDYLIGCGEEAVGDRYNRGGGNMAKAIGELSGCNNATGSDIKAFCCAPVHAIINASAMVSAGVFENVAVLAGGSFSKLGMKYRGHVKNEMPILEDVIAGFAMWIGPDDGASPKIRLDSIGKHTIKSGSSQQEIIQNLVINPLERCGMQLMDIDKYSTELHNPEITEPQGNGNVPLINYRIIGSLAVIRNEIKKNCLNELVENIGMPGFSPTQGHIASAVPFMGHAVEDIKNGKKKRVMFLAKGSLFLGRMTQLSDGISFILERNEAEKSYVN